MIITSQSYRNPLFPQSWWRKTRSPGGLRLLRGKLGRNRNHCLAREKTGLALENTVLAAKIQIEEPKLGMKIRGTLLLLVSTFKNLGHTGREGAAEPQAYKMLHFLNSRWHQAPFHVALTETKAESSFFKNMPVFLKIVFLIYLFLKSVPIIQFNL